MNQNQLAIMEQLFAALPAAARAKAAQGKINETLAAGITAGFPILSLRGKAWRVKYQGEERMLMEDDGRRPRYAVEVVIVAAADTLSKVWYEHGYVEGSNEPPDCWSTNGKVPDAGVPKRQSATCPGCKWNAWGSSRSQGGSGKAKDCADNKRLSVVAAGDIKSEAYGGPMMFRVPPASLNEVKAYADSLSAMRVDVSAIVTEMSFDPQAEYPKVILSPRRPLNDDEYAIVMEHQKSEVTRRMLEMPIEVVHTDGATPGVTLPGGASGGPATQAGAGQKPVQSPQAAPMGFGGSTTGQAPFASPAAPQPQQPASQPPHDPSTGEIMEEADEPDVAAKRKMMRGMGIKDDQINLVLGPPKMHQAQPEPTIEAYKLDKRYELLKSMNIPEDHIKGMIEANPSPPETNVVEMPKNSGLMSMPPRETPATAPAPVQQPATPPQQAEQQTTRRRRTKAEMAAAEEAAKQAQQTQAQPVAQPQPNGAALENPAVPPDFDNLVANLIASRPPTP